MKNEVMRHKMVEFYKETAYTHNYIFGYAMEPHGSPLIMIATKPQVGNIIKAFVFIYLSCIKMIMKIYYRH